MNWEFNIVYFAMSRLRFIYDDEIKIQIMTEKGIAWI